MVKSNQREMSRSIFTEDQLLLQRSKEDDSLQITSHSTTESIYVESKTIDEELNIEDNEELKKERIWTCLTQRWYVDVRMPESTTAGKITTVSLPPKTLLFQEVRVQDAPFSHRGGGP